MTSEHSVRGEKSLREAAPGGAAAHTAGKTPQHVGRGVSQGCGDLPKVTQPGNASPGSWPNASPVTRFLSSTIPSPSLPAVPVLGGWTGNLPGRCPVGTLLLGLLLPNSHVSSQGLSSLGLRKSCPGHQPGGHHPEGQLPSKQKVTYFPAGHAHSMAVSARHSPGQDRGRVRSAQAPVRTGGGHAVAFKGRHKCQPQANEFPG